MIVEIRMARKCRHSVNRNILAGAATCAAFALLGSAPIGSSAQQVVKHHKPSVINTSAIPPLGPPRPLKLPAIVERTLPNGLKLEILEDHSAPAVWMRLAIPAGSIRDPHEKVGLATLVAGLLDKGTASRAETDIANTIDGLGATLGASAGEDYTYVTATGLSTYTDRLFDLLADITLHATFPNEEIDRARTRTLNEITSSLSDPSTLADAAITRKIYGAHPYGNYSSGTPETLKSITQDDIASFHDTYFAPNVSTLFLVGDITPADAEAKVLAAFGSWSRKDVPALPAAPKAASGSLGSGQNTGTPQITLIDRPGSAQTQIRIGLLAAGYNTPDRIAGTLMTAVLGLGQFDGRLTKEIRVKRGLTYGVASFFSRHAEGGRFEISTFTKTATTAEVVKLALEETKKLANAEPPAEELQARKDFLNGSFAVSVATPPGVLERLTPAVLYGNGPNDLTLYASRIQAVTSSSVETIAANLNISSSQIVLVGDAKIIEKDLAGIGNVTKISADTVDLQNPSLLPPAESAAPLTKPTATEIDSGKALLAASIAAHGGDAFINLKTMILKGKGQITPPQLMGQQLPLEAAKVTISVPDKVRFDLTSSIGEIIFASPGKEAPAWISALGQVSDAPAGLGQLSDPTGLLRIAMQKGVSVRALPDFVNGRQIMSADGKALHGFAITDDQNATTSIYTDATTSLIRKIVLHSQNQVFTILLGDYQQKGGVQVPGLMKVMAGDVAFLTLKFSDIDVNPTVDASVFSRPK